MSSRRLGLVFVCLSLRAGNTRQGQASDPQGRDLGGGPGPHNRAPAPGDAYYSIKIALPLSLYGQLSAARTQSMSTRTLSSGHTHTHLNIPPTHTYKYIRARKVSLVGGLAASTLIELRLA